MNTQTAKIIPQAIGLQHKLHTYTIPYKTRHTVLDNQIADVVWFDNIYWQNSETQYSKYLRKQILNWTEVTEDSET